MAVVGESQVVLNEAIGPLVCDMGAIDVGAIIEVAGMVTSSVGIHVFVLRRRLKGRTGVLPSCQRTLQAAVNST
ncbi:hypothetical protein MFAL_15270 [Mycolicibacterium fallax]|nr:hypothetical protein MFAL_15270 [Mycolicibacterium fallax]